jgi:hypothetical protein
MRIARGALAWGAVVAVPATGLGYLLRGPAGAASVAVGVGLILANTAASAGLSTIAGRFSPVGGAMMSLPSFAFRLTMLFAALAVIDGRAFIDEPSFVIAFVGALVLVLAMEARAWRRTPWLVLSFGQEERA